MGVEEVEGIGVWEGCGGGGNLFYWFYKPNFGDTLCKSHVIVAMATI